VNCERDEQAVRDRRDTKFQKLRALNLPPSHPSRFSRKSRESRAKNSIRVITACGFLHCQSDRSGMDCAFPRSSWRKVESPLQHSSPSAVSWSVPIRSRRNNRPPRPHHCPQGPWLPGRPSPNFAHRVISAGNQRGGQEAIYDLNDSIEIKDCVRTRRRRECIAHRNKPSNLLCQVMLPIKRPRNNWHSKSAAG